MNSIYPLGTLAGELRGNHFGPALRPSVLLFFLIGTWIGNAAGQDPKIEGQQRAPTEPVGQATVETDRRLPNQSSPKQLPSDPSSDADTSADVFPVNEPKSLEIYLVIGQSNMAGRATIREEDKQQIDAVFLFAGGVKPWAVATNPLNRHSTIRKKMSMQRLSPAYSFAQRMSDSLKLDSPEKQIGIVMNARGGTRIASWLPGAKHFNEAVAQTRKALTSDPAHQRVLKGIIWHQGEGDCHPEKVKLYLGHLEIMVNGFREAFENDKLPFVAGELYGTESRLPFNQMLSQLPGSVRNTSVVSSAGTATFDAKPPANDASAIETGTPTSGTHFDSASQILMGTRYAEEMLQLQSSTRK